MKEIISSEWADWLQDPITQRFFEYITDFAQEVTHLAVTLPVMEGNTPSTANLEYAIFYSKLKQTTTRISFTEINNFYKRENEQLAK